MRMNDVIILRIYDFKKYFDFVHFYEKRRQLIDIVRQRTAEIFFDTPEEIRLYRHLILPWIVNGKISTPISAVTIRGNTIDISNEQFVISDSLMSSYNSLIEAKIDKEMAIGIVSLYILLGKESEQIDINSIAVSLLHGMTFWGESYISVYTDTKFESIQRTFPLVAKPIVNMSGNTIGVKNGEQTVTLASGKCVVGLFHNGKCCGLLDRTGGRDRQLTMIFDKCTSTTKLQIVNHGVEQTIDNVLSFFVYDDEQYYAYVMSNGECVIVPDNNYNLKDTIIRCKKKFANNEKLLAINYDNAVFHIITNLNYY